MESPGAIARALLQQYADKRRFEPFAAAFGIANLYDAYVVQAEFVRLLAERDGAVRGGHKIGLTSGRMQTMCGIDSPIAGVIFAQRIHTSGVRLDPADYGRIGLEFEIGLTLGADLPARTEPFDEATVAAAVASVFPAVEIVDDRHAEYAGLDVLSLVADNAWNAGAVCGPTTGRWPELASLQGRVYHNGSLADEGSGRDVLGNPLTALAWLANHALACGDRLRAGEIVLTGNLVTTKFVRPGDDYRFELADLGAVEVSVA